MRYSFLVFPLVILMDCVIFLNFLHWHEESVFEYEQRQLDLQVNYAVDAATQEMLINTPNLDTDYIDWGYVQVDPKAGYNAYIAMVLRSRGWADTKTNREMLEADDIPFFLVAAYDGYYLYYKQPVNKEYNHTTGVTKYTSYEMVWTPKIPYVENNGKRDAKISMYNMGNDNYSSYNTSLNYLDNNVKHTTNTIKDKNIVISEALTDACNTGLFNGLQGRTDMQFYLPDSYYEWTETNVVDKPTILTYLTRDGGIPKYENYSFGVGGSKIDEAEFVLCYQCNSKKYYTDVDNRALVESKVGVQVNTFRVMTSAKAACLEGYYYDMEFLGKGE